MAAERTGDDGYLLSEELRTPSLAKFLGSYVQEWRFYAFAEGAQLYLRDMIGSLTRPVRELKGFERVPLAPGESRPLRFALSEADLSFTRADGTRGVEPGRFQAWVGADCTAGQPVDFTL